MLNKPQKPAENVEKENDEEIARLIQTEEDERRKKELESDMELAKRL